MRRRHIVANILLGDGVLLILAGFLHLLATPVARAWMERDITAQTFRSLPVPFLLNHLTVGMLLIPFGVSTMYSAAGVRVGQVWARNIAITNGLAVLLIPLLILFFMGGAFFDAPLFLYMAALTTLIGLSMLLPLIWLRGHDGEDPPPHMHP